MPHLKILLIPYINLLNLAWRIKCLVLRYMEPLRHINNKCWKRSTINTAPDKRGILIVFFFYFLMKMYVVGTHTKRLQCGISHEYPCFCQEIRKISALFG